MEGLDFDDDDSYPKVFKFIIRRPQTVDGSLEKSLSKCQWVGGKRCGTDIREELILKNGPVIPVATTKYAYKGFESSLHVTDEKVWNMVQKSFRKKHQNNIPSPRHAAPLNLSNMYDTLLEKQVPDLFLSPLNVEEQPPDKTVNVSPDGTITIRLKHRTVVAPPVVVSIVKMTDEEVERVMDPARNPRFSDPFYTAIASISKSNLLKMSNKSAKKPKPLSHQASESVPGPSSVGIKRLQKIPVKRPANYTISQPSVISPDTIGINKLQKFSIKAPKKSRLANHHEQLPIAASGTTCVKKNQKLQNLSKKAPEISRISSHLGHSHSSVSVPGTAGIKKLQKLSKKTLEPPRLASPTGHSLGSSPSRIHTKKLQKLSKKTLEPPRLANHTGHSSGSAPVRIRIKKLLELSEQPPEKSRLADQMPIISAPGTSGFKNMPELSNRAPESPRLTSHPHQSSVSTPAPNGIKNLQHELTKKVSDKPGLTSYPNQPPSVSGPGRIRIKKLLELSEKPPKKLRLISHPERLPSILAPGTSGFKNMPELSNKAPESSKLASYPDQSSVSGLAPNGIKKLEELTKKVTEQSPALSSHPIQPPSVSAPGRIRIKKLSELSEKAPEKSRLTSHPAQLPRVSAPDTTGIKNIMPELSNKMPEPPVLANHQPPSSVSQHEDEDDDMDILQLCVDENDDFMML